MLIKDAPGLSSGYIYIIFAPDRLTCSAKNWQVHYNKHNQVR